MQKKYLQPPLTTLGLALLLVMAGSGLFLRGEGKSAPPPGWPARVRILYLPSVSQAATLSRFQPLTAHLEQALGLPVDAVSFDGYNDILLPLAKGEFDLTLLAPSAYLEAAEFSRLEVVAMELNSAGKRGYRSLLICRSDQDYRRVADARGQVLAFANYISTSGFWAPLMYFLQDLRETPAVFARQVVMAGDHQDVIMGVYFGLYDLGATNEVDLDRTLQAENIPPDFFRALWQSELIPGPPVCVRADLPPSFKAAALKALLDFNQNQEGLRSLKIGGYGPASEKDYEPVRAIETLRQ